MNRSLNLVDLLFNQKSPGPDTETYIGVGLGYNVTMSQVALP